MKPFLCQLAGLWLLFASATWAIEEPREPTLVAGLTYLRIRNLAKEAPPANGLAGARVIDLRGTLAPDDVPARWFGLFQAAGKGDLQLVLIDAVTSPTLLKALENRQGAVLTLAADSSVLDPDVAIATPIEADHAAREALDHGRPPIELLVAKREKRRYDEAAMVRDHSNGQPLLEGPPDDAAPQPAAPAASTEPKPAAPSTPLTDLVLQRAVHLFQALKALHKL